MAEAATTAGTGNGNYDKYTYSKPAQFNYNIVVKTDMSEEMAAEVTEAAVAAVEKCPNSLEVRTACGGRVGRLIG